MDVLPLRGQVWFASLPHIEDGAEKPFIIVSNNMRNKGLGSVLGVRVTSSTKHGDFDSQVRLGEDMPVRGTVICDDIEIIYKEELKRHVGGLTPLVMSRVDDGIRAALGLRY